MQFIRIMLIAMAVLGASVATTQAQTQGSDDYYYQEPPKVERRNNPALQEAGFHLQKHSQQYFLGTGLMAGGYLLAVTSISSQSGELALVGGLTTLAGLIVQIISHRHIGRAGESLQRGSLAQRLQIQGSSTSLGLGLAYKL